MSAMPELRLTVPMPQIGAIEVVDHLMLRVTWRAGIRSNRTDIVDLSPLINSLKLYRPLREDRMLFRTAHLIEEGRIIAWGDDDHIDMAADSVEQLAEESMTANDFRDFLKSNNLTHTEAAALLGYSRRQIENYLAGEPIPRVVVMACFGLAARKKTTSGPLARGAHAPPQIQVIDGLSSAMTGTISAPSPLITKGAHATAVPFSTTAPMLITAADGQAT